MLLTFPFSSSTIFFNLAFFELNYSLQAQVISCDSFVFSQIFSRVYVPRESRDKQNARLTQEISKMHDSERQPSLYAILFSKEFGANE